jgi:catechol 2,3-dioxygenase-like lactoylglutathione lyase family enzyme
MQIIDHVQVACSDYAKAKEFYVKALGALGWTLMMEFPMGPDRSVAGFGTMGKPYLWLANAGKPSITGHVALSARNEAEVQAFYNAGMGAGGTDNGPPGIRKEYHDKYYAAYVRDPDGNNIEAVWQGESEEMMAEEPAARRRTAAKRKPARRAAAKKPARKPAAKKPAARKTAAKKPAARRKPAARKTARRGRKTKR